MSWTSGPVIRNRNNILKKGYIKKETPAKLQFRSSWNWLHAHNKDIQKLSKSLMISDVVRVSELPSEYRNGIREAIVIKLSDGRKVTESFKIVNKFFERREDFNDELIKNKVIS